MRLVDRLGWLLEHAPRDAEAVGPGPDNPMWTWADVAVAAAEVDQMLDDQGAPPGARIGVVAGNEPRYLAVILALIKAGRCVVVLSPLQPPERLAADIGRSRLPIVIGPEGAVAHETVRATIEGIGFAVDASGRLHHVSGGRSKWDDSPAADAVFEVFTSGTTGRPKRITLGRQQVDASLHATTGTNAQTPPSEPELTSAVSIITAPLAHIGGLWNTVAAVCAGRRVVVLDRFRVDTWLAAVRAYRPKVVSLVPSALKTLADAGPSPEDLASIRAVTSGTAPCPPDLIDHMLEQYGVRVLPTYGATEFAGAVAGWSLQAHVRWWETKRGSVGQPFPGVRIRITDGERREIRDGRTGRVEVRAAQLPDGGADWSRTEDIGRLDEDGFLYILGRSDDAIVRGGFKIQPENVRDALLTHAAVRDAIVFGMPHERLGQSPVAAVVLDERQPVDAASLVDWCRRSLTPYEVPSRFLFLAEIPRTAIGKVDRSALLAIANAESGETP